MSPRIVTAAVFAVCVGFLFGFSSGEEPSAFSECADSFLSTQEIVLDQSEQLLGQLQSATRLPNARIVASTDDPGVFLFESDGTFVRQLGQPGQGPFEYQNPTIVRAYKDHIAIWDAGNMKVTVYGDDGTDIEEWTGFTWSITDFAIRDGVLYSYYGSLSAPYLRVWDLEAEEMIAEYDDAESVERAVLTQMEGSGSVSLHGDYLYALDPSNPAVHQYSLSDETETQLGIDDDAFSIPSTDASTVDELGFEEAMMFGMSSSRSYKVYALESSLLTVLQHGSVSYDAPLFDNGQPNPNARMESYDRYLHVYDMTHEGEVERCQRIDIDIEQAQSDHVLIGPATDGFFFRTLEETDTDIEYVLTEYSLPQ